jgi:hypothetical protein
MKNQLGSGQLIAAVFLILGCSHAVIIKTEDSELVKDGVAIKATSIQDKRKKFDIQMSVSNRTGKNIIFLLSDMTCTKGGVIGRILHTFFNAGERTIDMRVGQTKSFHFVCDFEDSVEGDYKIVIRRVVENPSGDGKTQGKLITENVTWQHAAR